MPHTLTTHLIQLLRNISTFCLLNPCGIASGGAKTILLENFCFRNCSWEVKIFPEDMGKTKCIHLVTSKDCRGGG